MEQVVIILFLGIVGPIVFFRLGMKTVINAFLYKYTKNEPNRKQSTSLFEVISDLIDVYQSPKIDNKLREEVQNALRNTSAKMREYSKIIDSIVEGRKL